MKRVKQIVIIVLAAAVLFGAAQLFLPHSVESVVGYELTSFQCCILAVPDEIRETESVELDKEELTKITNILSSIKLRRTFEKGNVIHHKDGFGWYQIAFGAESGQVKLPDLCVDSDGDVFISNVKYEITDEQKKAELMKLLESIFER